MTLQPIHLPTDVPPALVDTIWTDDDRAAGITPRQAIDQWAIAAQQWPPGSLQRQQYLTHIIQAATRYLWRDNSPDYSDALQQTWLYFCDRGCDLYDPQRGSLIHWLNIHLKWRLQDYAIQQAIDRRYRVSHQGWHPEANYDIFDRIADRDREVPPILQQVQTWIATDPTGELRRVHIKGHPQVTAQRLLEGRLPPETPWKTLATEFGISISTLSAFYQRHCLPRLRQFGEAEGYLEQA